MNHWFINHNEMIRLSVFISILIIMGLLEGFWPRRKRIASKKLRWFNNLSLVSLNTLLLRFLLPFTTIGTAQFAQMNGYGFFNYNSTWPLWVAVLASIMFLDFIIYLQHVLFHAIPALWRLHLVHHADLDLDFTSGARFHPIEILISLFIKIAAILIIGAPLVAVVIFEILLNGIALFNHSNFRLPPYIDKYLRWFVVTPDMHRVHHSIDPKETNTNFGFNWPWWDRLLGTYKAQPLMGHEYMFIGITEYRDPQLTTPLLKMLYLPFRKDPERIIK